MANPLAEEARVLSDQELGEAVNEAYRELFNLQFQRGTRQLQNPMAIRAARRQIARLRTILRERAQAAVDGAPIAQPPRPVAAPPQPQPVAEAQALPDADESAAAVEEDAPAADAEAPAADAPMDQTENDEDDAVEVEPASAGEAPVDEAPAEPDVDSATTPETNKDD